MALRRVWAAMLVALAPLAIPVRHAAAAPAVPRFSHVIEVFLENDDAGSTWESPATAPNLSKLRTENTYIPNFFGVGHASLDNYEAAFGAVEPTAQGKSDCAGQPYGSCIFPASIPTIGALFDAAGLGWKVYSEGMQGAPNGGPCLHSLDRNAADFYQGPGTNGYATRHNPAPWFDSILTKGGSEDYCKAHSVDLTHLDQDLQSSSSLPAFSFIEADTCHDGHDTQSLGGCSGDPEGPAAPAGVAAMDAWLPGFVAKVLSSPAWDDHSMLFLTLDESAATDTSGCKPCNDTSAGGRIGAVVISGLAAKGTSTWQGDHYGFVRTLEASFGLPTLKATSGAGAPGVTIHDADPGVAPLADIWTVSPATVKAASAADPQTLPATGRDPVRLIGLGLWGVVAGLALVQIAVRSAHGRRDPARPRRRAVRSPSPPVEVPRLRLPDR